MEVINNRLHCNTNSFCVAMPYLNQRTICAPEFVQVVARFHIRPPFTYSAHSARIVHITGQCRSRDTCRWHLERHAVVVGHGRAMRAHVRWRLWEETQGSMQEQMRRWNHCRCGASTWGYHWEDRAIKNGLTTLTGKPLRWRYIAAWMWE